MKKYFWMVIAFLIISGVFFVSSITPENEKKIDENVIKEMSGGKKVKVIIEMNDNIGKNTSILSYEIKKNSAISIVSDKKTIREFGSSSSFAAEITEGELISLANNPNIKKIGYDYPAKPLLQETVGIVHASKT